MLRDNTNLDKKDWLHFVPFILSFTGSIPYFFSSWDYKLLVAQNMLSEQWNMSQFNLNIFIPHKIDQVLNVLLLYFYSGALWYLIWKYKQNSNSRIYDVPQFKLIRNWLFVFTLIKTIIAISFSIIIAYILIYDDKSVFLEKASGPLLFTSLVYVAINMVIHFFPHIMYGLPIGLKLNTKELQTVKATETNLPTIEEPTVVLQEPTLNLLLKMKPQLFTLEYIEKIETHLQERIKMQKYLDSNCCLSKISDESSIPAHHLTFFFNDIIKISFSDWRNGIRIAHAINLISQGKTDTYTLQAVSLQCGFSSQNTFIRAFKNFTGTTPSMHMKSLS